MTDEQKPEQEKATGANSTYKLDMDEIDAMGDLSDLNLDEFLGDDSEAKATSDGAGAEPAAANTAETAVNDPFRTIDEVASDKTLNADLSAKETKENDEVILGGATDRITHRGHGKKQQDKLEKLQEQYMRLAADFDNFRKRSKRETEEAVRYANESILRVIVPIMDNLERALESGQTGELNDLKATVSGVSMVSMQLSQDLRRFGLKAFDAVGEKFDPKAHEAFEMKETDERPPGTVVHMYQRGYWMNDRLLRPAMVSVAKAPKKKPEPVPEPVSEEVEETVLAAEDTGQAKTETVEATSTEETVIPEEQAVEAGDGSDI